PIRRPLRCRRIALRESYLCLRFRRCQTIITLVITNIWIGGLCVLIVLVAALLASVWLRRHTPEGGFFSDSDRAAGIFGSIGTLFSVLLALVILLSVETYSDTKSHANAEADLVLEQFQLARPFPSGDQFQVQ